MWAAGSSYTTRRAASADPRPARRAAAAAGAALLLGLFGAPTSRASQGEIFGLGSRASAMGGAFTAVADDFSAVWYNPAGLVQVRKPHRFLRGRGFWVETGLTYMSPRLTIERVGAVPDEAQAPDRHYYDDELGIVMGITFEPFDLQGFLDRKSLALGLGVFTPFEYLFRWKAEFPSDPHFVLFEDYTKRLVVLPAVSFEIAPGWSIGAGANVLIRILTDTIGTVDIDVREIDFENQEITIPLADNHLGEYSVIAAVAAPVVGILGKPWEWLSLGLSYRGRLYLNDYGTTGPQLVFQVNDQDIFTFDTTFQQHFAHYFSPDEVTGGLAARPFERLTVSVDLGWQNWSGYLDKEHRKSDPAFRDTLVPSAGAVWRALPWLAVRGGYSFRPSPAPEQTGETNLVDNDRHMIAIGAEGVFESLSVSAHFQYHWLVPRTMTKGTEDQASYRAEGGVVAGGLVLSVPF